MKVELRPVWKLQLQEIREKINKHKTKETGLSVADSRDQDKWEEEEA